MLVTFIFCELFYFMFTVISVYKQVEFRGGKKIQRNVSHVCSQDYKVISNRIKCTEILLQSRDCHSSFSLQFIVSIQFIVQ